MNAASTWTGNDGERSLVIGASSATKTGIGSEVVDHPASNYNQISGLTLAIAA